MSMGNIMTVIVSTMNIVMAVTMIRLAVIVVSRFFRKLTQSPEGSRKLS